MTLELDEATHTYRFDGVVVPGVTQVLRPAMAYDFPREPLERALQEGRAIHKAVEFRCKEIVFDAPEWMKGHMDAWDAFVSDTGFCLYASEEKQYHPVHGYAGTLDLAGRLTRLRGSPVAIIDVKRSFFAGAAINLQTCAYAMQWDYLHPGTEVERRFGLQLRGDGTYRLEPFEAADDLAVFLSFLTVFRWRQKHIRRATGRPIIDPEASP